MSEVDPSATDEEGEAGTTSRTQEARSRKWFKKKWKRVRNAIFLVAAIATIILALPNIAPSLLSVAGIDAAPDARPGQQPSASAEARNPTTPNATSIGIDIRPGFNCLGPDAAAVTCDGPHSYEAVAMTADCASSVALPYLGGNPDVDVLRPGSGFSVVQTDSGPVCTVTSPDGGSLSSLAHDALSEPTGDVWRWCLAQEDDESVSCSVPHDREVIGPSSDVAGPLECGARADRYLEVPLTNHDRQLYVTSEQVDGAERCVVGVRGDNRLTASLRRLRSSSPPISAS